MAAGLPTVRADPSEPRALDVADRQPPTCAPTTPVTALPSGLSIVVVNDAGIVLGRVPADRSRTSDTAEQIMHPGPTTVRADEPLSPLLGRMRDRNVSEMIVTTPDGHLIGVVRP
jgi:CBS domain-containing protein